MSDPVTKDLCDARCGHSESRISALEMAVKALSEGAAGLIRDVREIKLLLLLLVVTLAPQLVRAVLQLWSMK